MRLRRFLPYPFIALPVLALGFAMDVDAVAQSAPAWWSSYGVISGNPPNDYAAANQGQAKNLALAAVQELDADLAQFGGAGPQLDALAATLLAGPTAQTNDYAAVNIGQIKTLTKPFYDRLLALGYYGSPLSTSAAMTSGTYPWVLSGLPANDYAAANIGQLKYLFSFDVTYSSSGDGIPDWWLIRYFGGLTVGGTPIDPNAIAPMGYGITNLQAFTLGINPSDPYNGHTPTFTKTSGDGQSAGTSDFLSSPLVVTVSIPGIGAIANAPVAFQVGSGGGFLATTLGGAVSSTLNVLTGPDGTASVYCACPTGSGQFGVTATTGVSPRTASLQFTATSVAPDTTVAAPSDVTPRITSYGTVDIFWTNHDQNTAHPAIGYDIERSDDLQTWVVIGSVGVTSTFVDTSPPPGNNFYYRVNSKGAH